MLVGREVGHDVKAFLLTEDALKDGVGEIQCIAAKLVRDVQAISGADIANKFGEAIFIEINNDYASRFETQNGFNEAGADRTCSTDNTNAFTFYLARQSVFVRLYIGSKHADRAEGNAIGNEFI